ncbi:hypothetical protein AJ80_02302 [Polytolypa hystricis UAMH7299]|uniref:Tubulin-specific chaperone A n=1 Tax=Polytolypa hystricis (strain UAMH7299) TaxID=1447883 RepID=A0A2B7YPU5_POLH7|nr:hypothetical protein AJ80_02302 [Polytolypa hystricis UAMH7299]
MAPRSPLSISTSVVVRLVKEEASYHRELKQQEERIKKLEATPASTEDDDDDGNREFILKQERQALEETKNVLPSVKQKITDAVAKLDQLLIEEGHKGMESNVAEIDAAKEAISRAKTAVREIS